GKPPSTLCSASIECGGTRSRATSSSRASLKGEGWKTADIDSILPGETVERMRITLVWRWTTAGTSGGQGVNRRCTNDKGRHEAGLFQRALRTRLCRSAGVAAS